MPNMSYCRFLNTLLDMQDCLRAIKQIKEEGKEFCKELSQQECEAQYELYDVAKEFVEVMQMTFEKEELEGGGRPPSANDVSAQMFGERHESNRHST